MRAQKADAGRRTAPFLLEIGCEEIPARFLAEAQKGLGARLEALLREARLLPSEAEGSTACTYSTPRRLVVYLPALRTCQPDQVEEIMGPPLQVAVAADGQYTRAAQSFAQRHSAQLEELVRTSTPKGQYLALRKTVAGRHARELLPEILPAAILGLSFPKSMYWTAKSAPRFVRPIRWVLALLGKGKGAEIVEFELLGVRAGNFTFGHRALGNRPRPVHSFEDYTRKLRQLNVEIDYARRVERIRTESKALVDELGLHILPDEWLVDWVACSTEWPRPLLGHFEERFLSLPREILTTVMRDHQRYFAVQDGEGNLRPLFLALLNLEGDEKGLIRQGHERVLAARFRDAEFFWDADLRLPLADRMPWLERVTYQAELGSYADKIRRMKVLAGHVCERLEGQGNLGVGQRRSVLRAVELAKCDLTTQMVREFAELEGVVGGLYAERQGELEEVAVAIYDHYLPRGLEDHCPRTRVGALVSLVDKLDAVAAGFAVGHEPRGSSDPFAIRRQANGIIKVLLELSIPIDLDSEIELALEDLHEAFPFDSRKALAAMQKFLRERLTYYLENVAGLRYDTVRAAMQARYPVFEPLEVLGHARAIEKIRSSDDFVSLAQSAKRIRNILRKSARPEDYAGGRLDPQRLEAGPERHLYTAYERVREEAAQKRAGGNIYGALECIAGLRPAVDAFFDKVLVMAEDAEVRRNRLQLLLALDRLFTEDADLSEVERGNVDASTSAD